MSCYQDFRQLGQLHVRLLALVAIRTLDDNQCSCDTRCCCCQRRRQSHRDEIMRDIKKNFSFLFTIRSRSHISTRYCVMFIPIKRNTCCCCFVKPRPTLFPLINDTVSHSLLTTIIVITVEDRFLWRRLLLFLQLATEFSTLFLEY